MCINILTSGKRSETIWTIRWKSYVGDGRCSIKGTFSVMFVPSLIIIHVGLFNRRCIPPQLCFSISYYRTNDIVVHESVKANVHFVNCI